MRMLRSHSLGSGQLLAAVALGGLIYAACGGGDDSSSAGGAPGGSLVEEETIVGGVIVTPNPRDSIRAFSTRDWATDFTRHTIPYDEIEPGGPPKDGIPAIDSPKFTGFSEADRYLHREEPVMVVEVDGDARAYPLQILITHEIVNDVIMGEPIVVTYCPLCNTALAFRRTFEGRLLDFGTTGNLRFSDLVMYDRQTESWWQQITGEGIIGEFAGRGLEFVPASIMAWQDFKAAYPDGRVLSRETGFARDYGTNGYIDYDSSDPFLFSGPLDRRLGSTERVVSVVIGDEAAAYPFGVLEVEKVVNDEVGGSPVAIFFKKGTKSALDKFRIRESRDVGAGVAFSRDLNGEVLTFKARGDTVVDDQTGTEWDIAGKGVKGPLAGEQLETLVHANHFWFAWAIFRPDTRIFGS